MTVKRSRTGSSWRDLDMQVVNDGGAVNPTAVVGADAVGEPSRSSILTLAYPVRVGVSDQRKIGGFLERCYYCNKRIAQNAEVFMYGILCAFCSAKCREFQIAQDRTAKKQPASVEEMVIHRQGFAM